MSGELNEITLYELITDVCWLLLWGGWFYPGGGWFQIRPLSSPHWRTGTWWDSSEAPALGSAWVSTEVLREVTNVVEVGFLFHDEGENWSTHEGNREGINCWTETLGQVASCDAEAHDEIGITIDWVWAQVHPKPLGTRQEGRSRES